MPSATPHPPPAPGSRRLATTSFDDTVRVWDAARGGPALPQLLSAAHNNKTGQYILPFRAVWTPAADALAIGEPAARGTPCRRVAARTLGGLLGQGRGNAGCLGWPAGRPPCGYTRRGMRGHHPHPHWELASCHS